MENKPKIIVILGPTATGKSDLAVRLAFRLRSGQAKKLGYNGGEIISADSRQVYKGLDIGTGKVPRDKVARHSKNYKLSTINYLYKGVPHYLLDVADPKRKFTVAQYKKKAEKSIKEILRKNKLPIIVGGTGFYIQAVADNLVLPEVKPNLKLRKELSKKSAEELFEMLKKIDPKRASSIDRHNPRRLIRAIEIAKSLGQTPPHTPHPIPYTPLFVGLDLPDEKLKAKIKKRLNERIKIGMIDEVKKLHRLGLSYKRMEELGLEYKFLAQYLKGEISKDEMTTKLETEIWHYTKRQRTWFKRDKRIKWFEPQNIMKVESEVRKFLKL